LIGAILLHGDVLILNIFLSFVYVEPWATGRSESNATRGQTEGAFYEGVFYFHFISHVMSQNAGRVGEIYKWH